MIDKMNPLYFRGVRPVPVIPTVYTDALSYGEQLGIIGAKVDECIAKVNEIIDDNNTFKAELLAELQAFKTTITNQQNTFETDITNQQNTFETNITNQQTTFETTTLAALNTWKTNTEQSLNTWKTQTEGVYQAQIDELEQAFDELAEGIQIELGIANDFGSSTALAISQKKFTDEIDNLNFEARIKGYYVTNNLISGSGVNSSGAVVENANLSRTPAIKVKGGEYIRYYAYLNTSYYVIAFYDIHGTFLPTNSVLGLSTNYTRGEVTVPNDASTVIFTTSRQKPNVFFEINENNEITKQFEEVNIGDMYSANGKFVRKLLYGDFSNGYYDTTSETVIGQDTYYTSPKMLCKGFTSVEYSGFNDTNTHYMDFYTSNDEFLVRYLVQASNGKIATAIPENAYYSNITMRIIDYTELTYTLYSQKSLSIFEKEGLSNIVKFGVCGDSLTVGFIGTGTWEQQIRNLFYSWGQNVARRLGNVCLNFGFSGATTTGWFTDNTHGWVEVNNADNKCQAYIVAIGTNDGGSIGTINDINLSDYTQNANTFYGNFAKIIQAIHSFANTAKIFVCTIAYPRNDADKNTAIRNICELLDYTFLLDLDSESTRPLFESIYNRGDYFERHYSPNGYVSYGTIVKELVGEQMLNHPTLFRDLHLIPFGSNNVIN